MTKITGFETYDVRFPTSRTLAGSDAMNPAPDYSAAYVIVRTDAPDPALAGHGFAFTIGRGNDVQLAAIRLLEPFLAGQDLDEVLADLGGLYRRLVSDSPLHWLGPACGVMHMATGAVLNACWDLAARRAGKPLWLLLAEMTPEQIIGLVDFRYLSDALTPDEALDLLRAGRGGPAPGGSPRSAGRLPGLLDRARLARLLRRAARGAVRGGRGRGLHPGEDQGRRGARGRQAPLRDRPGGGGRRHRHGDRRQPGLGRADRHRWIRELAPFRPGLGRGADRARGHPRHRRHPPRRAPVQVATGEHVANRVMFKQLLQAGAMDIMQIDACRVAGVNENIANLLLAAKFGVPVCPHAGGVGLCEIVQHLSMFDYVALSGTVQGRRIEWIDHLHEHFAAPAVVVGGRYRAPDPAPPPGCRPSRVSCPRVAGGVRLSATPGAGVARPRAAMTA